MDILHALIVSFVEGITEFLPVSSTGHLILVEKLLAIQETPFVKSFDIIIQLGAILAVAALFAKKLLANKDLWPKLIAAFVPTAIVGFTLYPLIKKVLLGNTLITAISLLIGGIVLIVFEQWQKKSSTKSQTMKHLTIKQSVIIGIIQSLSVVPGVSRAAATIVGGMLSGLSREEAVEFSFLLALPTIAAATGLDLAKTHAHFSVQEWMLLGVGFIGAFISAIVTVKVFVNFVKTQSLALFGWYRIAVALLFLFIVH